MSDRGRFAAAKGFDAIFVDRAGWGKDGNYYVILNRTAVRVQGDV